MAIQVNAPMTREEFMDHIGRLRNRSGTWVYAWLLGWVQMDLNDQQRGDAWAAVEDAASSVLRLPASSAPGGGDSPLVP